MNVFYLIILFSLQRSVKGSSCILKIDEMQETYVATTFQKVHTGTFLPSGKYLVHICCFFWTRQFLF